MSRQGLLITLQGAELLALCREIMSCTVKREDLPLTHGRPCLEFTRTHTATGYGSIYYKGHYYTTHRVMFHAAHLWRYKKPLPPELVVHHVCLLKACAEIAHMESVTSNEAARLAIALRAVEGRCSVGHEIAGANEVIRKVRGPRGKWRTQRVCVTCASSDGSERFRYRDPDVLRSYLRMAKLAADDRAGTADALLSDVLAQLRSAAGVVEGARCITPVVHGDKPNASC